MADARDGTLAGADVTLPASIRYPVETVGLAEEVAPAATTATPAASLEQEAERGRLAPGAKAGAVWLSDRHDVQGTWIGGESLLAR